MGSTIKDEQILFLGSLGLNYNEKRKDELLSLKYTHLPEDLNVAYVK